MKRIKDSIFGKTLSEIQIICKELGFKKFNAQQITDWLYKKNVLSIDEMSNLPKKTREILKEIYVVGRSESKSIQNSEDGTKKYLFATAEDKLIETAYIPEKERATLCISTQIGCKMNCKFCLTGKQGYKGNLQSGEILNQLVSIPERDKITNIVYMGMGEPLDNLNEVLKSIEILTSEWGYAKSPRRITVSSIGLIPAVKRFYDETECHLAISLHSPFEHERSTLMPIEKTNPLPELMKLLKSLDFSGQRRLSFEYIVFKGINDSMAHVKKLAELVKGLNIRVNLIPYHEIGVEELKAANYNKLEFFRDELNKFGIISTIRKSRGQDISAACGLLSTKKEQKKI